MLFIRFPCVFVNIVDTDDIKAIVLGGSLIGLLYKLGVGSRRVLISCVMFGPCARPGVNSF